MLNPIYEDTAERMLRLYPQPGKLVLGKVDAEKAKDIAEKYKISKYPTLKLFRYGKLLKREYRGQRTADALQEFLKEQLNDNVGIIHDQEHLDEIEPNQRNMIGYFENDESSEFDVFKKVASQLRHDCHWYAVFGELSMAQRTGGNNVVFKPPLRKHNEALYSGSLKNQAHFEAWSVDKCVPLVREITFENAEELTEEGVPFLILFYNPENTSIIETYHAEVSKQLIQDKNSINFLTADGNQFSHPLHHLGKNIDDLPILCIDSFRHMYLFPDIKQMTTPGVLKKFIDDLHSGALHNRFHGRDDVPPTPAGLPSSDPSASPQDPQSETQPPESTFQKLAPNEKRYSIKRDEL